MAKQRNSPDTKKKEYKKRDRGRPSLLNETVLNNLCEKIKKGFYLNEACIMCGLTYRTFQNWNLKGEEDDAKGLENEYVYFFHSIKKARLEGEEKLLNVIDSAALEVWTAAAWRLERMVPQKYGRRLSLPAMEGTEIDVTENFKEIAAALANSYYSKRDDTDNGTDRE